MLLLIFVIGCSESDETRLDKCRIGCDEILKQHTGQHAHAWCSNMYGDDSKGVKRCIGTVTKDDKLRGEEKKTRCLYRCKLRHTSK